MSTAKARLVIALLALLALASTARADRYNWDTWPVRKPSPPRFLFELKFGAYSPDIDKSPGLTGTPFSDLFTNQYSGEAGRQPGERLLTTVELDWLFFHGFGSLGIGASIGFQRRTAHSFEFNDGAPCVVYARDPTGRGCVRSSDETTLTFMPITLLAVWRFDLLERRYRVPFVPYIKGGITYYFWWIDHQSFDLSRAVVPDGAGGFGTSTGIGGTAGLVAQPGLALSLDWLDPTASRVLAAETGIRHTYVFAELNYAWVTGLGFKDKMVFSDLQWSAGLSGEF